MAIIAPEETSFLGWLYPAEDCDPHYDQLVGLYQQIEKDVLFNRIRSNALVGGGGTRTWNGTTGLLTWTADFVIPILFWGYKISCVYGPDSLTRAANLADGQALVVSLPQSMNGNVTKNFSVVSQLVADPSLMVCAVRSGSSLYIRGVGELN